MTPNGQKERNHLLLGSERNLNTKPTNCERPYRITRTKIACSVLVGARSVAVRYNGVDGLVVAFTSAGRAGIPK